MREWYTKIWFINRVDNVNWPPHRDWKADVSSVRPSSERIDSIRSDKFSSKKQILTLRFKHLFTVRLNHNGRDTSWHWSKLCMHLVIKWTSWNGICVVCVFSTLISVVIVIYTSTVFAMKNTHMCNLHILGDLLLYLTHAKIQWEHKHKCNCCNNTIMYELWIYDKLQNGTNQNFQINDFNYNNIL